MRARLRGADGALANYEQQVLLALKESENAFSDYAKQQQRLLALVRQSHASRAAAAEDAQALAEVALYRGIVAIYKALGGGWQPSA